MIIILQPIGGRTSAKYPQYTLKYIYNLDKYTGSIPILLTNLNVKIKNF